jgi:non-canonical purine NTP pyrophosphatase (RdgB/HAM1 family)
MSKINVVFVTGNVKKLEEVRKIMGSEFNVINHDIDLPEIQTTEVSEVIEEKIKAALEAVKDKNTLSEIVKKFQDNGATDVKGLEDMTIFCEDTGFFIDNMSNDKIRFPGALIKFYFKAMKNKGIIERDAGSNASIECHIGLIIGGKIENSIIGKINGKIAKEFKEEGTFGFDPAFVPDLPSKYSSEQGKTFGDLDADIKNDVSHRALAFKSLKKLLLKDGGKKKLKKTSKKSSKKLVGGKKTTKKNTKKTTKNTKKTTKK